MKQKITKDSLLKFIQVIVASMGLNPLTMVQGKEIERLFKKEFGKQLFRSKGVE